LKLTFILFLVLASNIDPNPESSSWQLPVNYSDRQSWNNVQLTSIGEFGRLREARPTVPAHLHTAIDFKRPAGNFDDSPIFAIGLGRVISIRDDGPFAQIIIEHQLTSKEMIWSVYEHIADIQVELDELVNSNKKLARLMNKSELDKYGWQFDHLHFEIMKRPPYRLKDDSKNPNRKFATYSLVCYDIQKLEQTYYYPKDFFNMVWSKR